MDGFRSEENTVLQLSKALNDELGKLRQLLDGSFARGPKAEGTAEGRPAYANVLDEVIENLEACQGQIVRVSDVVRASILSKIG